MYKNELSCFVLSRSANKCFFWLNEVKIRISNAVHKGDHIQPSKRVCMLVIKIITLCIWWFHDFTYCGINTNV